MCWFDWFANTAKTTLRSLAPALASKMCVLFHLYTFMHVRHSMSLHFAAFYGIPLKSYLRALLRDCYYQPLHFICTQCSHPYFCPSDLKTYTSTVQFCIFLEHLGLLRDWLVPRQQHVFLSLEHS